MNSRETEAAIIEAIGDGCVTVPDMIARFYNVTIHTDYTRFQEYRKYIQRRMKYLEKWGEVSKVGFNSQRRMEWRLNA